MTTLENAKRWAAGLYPNYHCRDVQALAQAYLELHAKVNAPQPPHPLECDRNSTHPTLTAPVKLTAYAIKVKPGPSTPPVGTILEMYAPVTTDNWLPTDGRALSRTDYYELFAVIGVAYGAGDGNGTFNIPKLGVV